MKQTSSARSFLPENKTLENLKQSAAGCEGCELFKNATQTVFGEGRNNARIIFVGEQPGDQEDKEGKPFVGPAGKLFNKALEEAGIDRGDAYVTNAVKHFSFVWKGPRRIHQKPRLIEVNACSPWLEAEIEALKSELVICLGATAAQSLLGKEFRVTKERGRFLKHESGTWMMATVHPSSILRARDQDERDEQMEAFIADLKKIPEFLNGEHRSE